MKTCAWVLCLVLMVGCGVNWMQVKKEANVWQDVSCAATLLLCAEDVISDDEHCTIIEESCAAIDVLLNEGSDWNPMDLVSLGLHVAKIEKAVREMNDD